MYEFRSEISYVDIKVKILKNNAMQQFDGDGLGPKYSSRHRQHTMLVINCRKRLILSSAIFYYKILKYLRRCYTKYWKL